MKKEIKRRYVPMCLRMWKKEKERSTIQTEQEGGGEARLTEAEKRIDLNT